MTNIQKINNIVDTTSDELKTALTLESVKQIADVLVNQYKLDVTLTGGLDELIEDSSNYGNNEAFILFREKYMGARRITPITDEENSRRANNLCALCIFSGLSSKYKTLEMQ